MFFGICCKVDVYCCGLCKVKWYYEGYGGELQCDVMCGKFNCFDLVYYERCNCKEVDFCQNYQIDWNVELYDFVQCLLVRLLELGEEIIGCQYWYVFDIDDSCYEVEEVDVCCYIGCCMYFECWYVKMFEYEGIGKDCIEYEDCNCYIQDDVCVFESIEE